MTLVNLLSRGLLAAAIVFTLGSTGCNRDDKSGGPAKAKTETKIETTHAGWWCQEHGVPEEECSICMSAANAKKKYKDNGDWCKEHNRAGSQCFKCDPKRYKKYEEKYVAKYGTKPKPPDEEEFQK
jgi:hypothetical protein